MKKNPKSQSYNPVKDDDRYDEQRRGRHRVKALQQNKDAKRIERALKRRDYSILTEDLY